MTALTIVYDGWASERELLAKAILDNIGQKPVQARAQGLAGVNDIVEWIDTLSNWQAIAIGLSAWLTGKIGDDAYEALKARLTKAFGNEADGTVVKGLASDVNEVARKVQERGGEMLLTMRDSPVLEDAMIYRSKSTVVLSKVLDDGGVGLSMQIIEFSLSVRPPETEHPPEERE